MDAITMLKKDHENVEQLLGRFEKAGPRAFAKKREIVDRVIGELSVHAAVEEQVFYPVVRATVPDTDEVALESLEEHHLVKVVLAELERMSPEDERFDAKVAVLAENVRHHVEEEEQDLFPKVRDELGRAALGDLGEAMEAARRIAPTHPHPRSPDTPPGNVVVGAVAGVADRLGDTVSGVAQGGVTAVGDVIATVLRRKKPRVSPTGSRVTRKTARRVRAEVDDATRSVIDATTSAKENGRKAARSAKESGQRGARSTKENGRKAARTATRAKATKTSPSRKRPAASTGKRAAAS